MNKPQNLIFDLDGTLIDTLEDLADAANLALQTCGLDTLPVEQYRYLVGAGARNLVLRCLAAVAADRADDEQLVRQLAARFKANYEQNWHRKSAPYAGIPQLVSRLVQAGCKMAVLSNKPDEFTQAVVRHFFPEKPFMAVLGQKEGLPLKPDPAGALLLCRQIGAEPSGTALIGDVGSDMETAKRAGMLPLAVLWGFRPAAELESAGAAWLFGHPDQLAAWLLDPDTANQLK